MVEDAGIGVNSDSSAGTSTLREAVADPVVNEVQAGTYAVMEPDLGVLDLPLRPALRVEAAGREPRPRTGRVGGGQEELLLRPGTVVVRAAR